MYVHLSSILSGAVAEQVSVSLPGPAAQACPAGCLCKIKHL